mmetsp:Transcript_38821/g.91303  ORF Transcript_38821/g.91303 Transcript_38821/m.91303 type:complete len:305 (-) Transcript_38821:51-965(-)
MQFTPQQLTGGPKYAHKVRIGNWSEDLELEEIKLKDYLKKKETGQLFVNAKQKQLEESLVVTELSASPDGQLRFGHKVMLLNHQSNGLLASNPFDAVTKTHEAYAVTTTANSNPCVRSTFVLERADPHDGYDDDVLHYGQNVRFKIEPFSKILDPVYLHSELVTALTSSKYSRHQECCALGAVTGETLWQVLYPDTHSRFEMDGAPVLAGSPLCVRHVQTGSFLSSDEIPYPNLFGTEFEVHCHHYYSMNKTQNLTSEKKGDITGDYALRRHGLPNIWTIITGSHGQDVVSASLGGTALPPADA